eukprot:4841472-Pyramimonas_sp.AAC.1
MTYASCIRDCGACDAAADQTQGKPSRRVWQRQSSASGSSAARGPARQQEAGGATSYLSDHISRILAATARKRVKERRAPAASDRRITGRMQQGLPPPLRGAKLAPEDGSHDEAAKQTEATPASTFWKLMPC